MYECPYSHCVQVVLTRLVIDCGLETSIELLPLICVWKELTVQTQLFTSLSVLIFAPLFRLLFSFLVDFCNPFSVWSSWALHSICIARRLPSDASRLICCNERPQWETSRLCLGWTLKKLSSLIQKSSEANISVYVSERRCKWLGILLSSPSLRMPLTLCQERELPSSA